MKEKEHIIKFSHDYTKLPAGWIGTKARLIEANPSSMERLKKTCPDFLEYDTEYRDQPGKYPLTFTTGIILLFYHIPTKTIFTTLRPFNISKYSYYSKLRGKIFKLEEARQ